MKKLLAAFFILILTISTLSAQSPKREMRATWLTTVSSSDWPRTSGATNQKNEMIRMLDSIKNLKMNAVFFQVRSRCDAMYNSAYEPWSSDLRVSRGTNPGYDPLAFVLEECHKRGLECHAWLNPYRYNSSGSGYSGSNNHALNYQNTNPEWLLWYSGNVVLDPALPEVRMRIKSVVGDILNKYDVDGIIFDDYFYPYGGTSNEDNASVTKYKPAGMDVHDWRRDNINRMIADVYDTIQVVRPYVRFGVSPFGIWTTNHSVAATEGLTLPSGISGSNMYQQIYCDPVAWMKAGTVDYISPQLYWAHGGGQDYGTLCPWWADVANKFGVHFYSSMAVYKYVDNDQPDFTVSEMVAQSHLNRTSAKDGAPGHVFFRTLNFMTNAAFLDQFKTNVFSKQAITPAIGWKPAPDQGTVTFNATVGNTVSWEYATTDKVRYAVYAVPTTVLPVSPAIFSISDYLVGISYAKQYTLPAGISTSTHTIAVSVLDRYGNEFAPRTLGGYLTEAVKTQLVYPDDYAIMRMPVTFQWSVIENADSYIWQLAANADFTDIVCTRETTDKQFDSGLYQHIKEDGRTYYWRVRTRKVNTPDSWSETRRIILSPNGESALKTTIASGKLKAKIYDNELNIETDAAGNAVIRVYNLFGQLLSSSEPYLQSGRNILPFNCPKASVSLINIQTDKDITTIKW